MEFLSLIHQQYLKNLKFSFKRDLLDQIDWTNRMIGITGARGVGKTTLLLQYIKQTFGFSEDVLYLTMDHIQLSGVSLLDVAAFHFGKGGTHLVIDEIHKSKSWSGELKTIYDLYPGLHVVFTSSSILEIYKGQADLSRRVILYDMEGLSFREYLQIETGINLEILNIKEVISQHIEISHEILNKGIKPLKHFKNYLQYGYYPFYLENLSAYPIKLLNIINLTLEVDLVSIKNVDPVSIPKIKKLINILANSVPFQPNVSKLAGSIEITRNTLLLYFQYLAQAKILNLLQESGSTYSYIAKPEKVLLHNPNLMACLQPNNLNSGSIRETFFVNSISPLHLVNTSSRGDFMLDDTYVFEVGGHSKTNKQISGLPDSFLAVDDIEIGSRNKIPLWLFGFLK
ncbi:MAG: ATP-binding protein [Saprospiraceae bacterium]|nr:ATP-binding protein [Saprospiraceae bacterium]